MDGSIGHLRGHYLVVGAHQAAPGLAARLDRIMRERLVKSYEDALDEAFRDDDALYVLRRVEAKTTLLIAEDTTDERLARHWGEHLAGAVVRAIAANVRDGANFIRFDNQADYIAHFLVALLKGRAWEQWFYGEFAPLRQLDTPRALSRVLAENREHLPAILAYLHRYGALDSLIAALNEVTRRTLWQDEPQPHADAESVRPLLTLAMRLVDALEAWAGARPNSEELFQAYLQTAPTPPDWRDHRGLTISVCDALRFFHARRLLRRASDISDERFPALLDKALEGFDWVDLEWLQGALLELLGKGVELKTDLPARPAGLGASPRQRDLLATLSEVLQSSGLRFDGDDSNTAADALRLFGLLIARAPQWADGSTAKAIIQSLLVARAAMRQSSSGAEFIERLRRRDVEGALHLLAEDKRERAAGACRLLAGLGEQALALVERLAGEANEAAWADGVESDCAGWSLLLRAMLDVRLHALVEEAGYPQAVELPRMGALLLSLALGFGGELVAADGHLDQGACLLAGLKERVTLDALRACWSGVGVVDHTRFQAALLKVLVGQRLLQPPVMHLFRVPSEDGAAYLVAGDESAMLWPLGRVVETTAETEAAIIEWLAVWEEATGVRPALVIKESVAISDAFRRERGLSLTVASEKGEMLDTHEAGQTALLAAIEALGQTRLWPPDTGLTLTLVSCVLLRLWARWLRQFSTSSIPFLLENFIRRHGRLHAGRDGLLVEIERCPLDIIIEMVGYLTELERVPWLDGGRVKFRLQGA